MTTISLLYQLIAKRLNRDIDKLAPDTLLESLGIDSLGMAELLFDLEDHLNFKLITPTNPIKTIKDVADLVDASRPK
jgi:acyl carrier protein